MLWIASASEQMAHGTCAWPKASRHCLVNDGDRLRGLVVAIGKVFSLEKHNAHGFEVILGDRVMERTELFARSSHGAGNSDCLTPFVILKADHCCQAGPLNSPQRATPPYQLIVESATSCLAVAKLTGMKP